MYGQITASVLLDTRKMRPLRIAGQFVGPFTTG
jgi:hypothetical protein